MRSALTLGAAAALVACSTARLPETPAAPQLERGRAYDLVVHAASCWTGGLWSDALGEQGAARLDGIRARCNDLLDEAGEPSEKAVRQTAAAFDVTLHPEGPYYALRAIEPTTVAKLAEKVRTLAGADPGEAPHARALENLLVLEADAARETLHARRAADQVKEDETRKPLPAGYSSDKAAAAPELAQAAATRALLRADVGPYTPEARALGLLEVVDRTEVARGLPKHLKVYAVAGVYKEIFGVDAPSTSTDAAAPIPSGTWLGYLTRTSEAAGHPLPGDARDPQNREPLAWTGVLQALGQRLRGESAKLPPNDPIGTVSRAVATRLDDSAEAERQAYEAHAPKDR
jgi:hypothetical protein